MTCDICGISDILAKMSSFELFFFKKFRHFLKYIDKLRVKNFMRNYEQQIQTQIFKSKSWEAEHNFLKVEKDSFKNV